MYNIRASSLQGLGYIMVANVVLLSTDVTKHRNKKHLFPT